MSFRYVYDDDDTDSVHSDDTYEAIYRERRREAALQEQQEDDRRREASLLASLKQEYHVHERRFIDETRLLCQNNIRLFGTMQLALDHARQPQRRHMFIFARDRPKLKTESMTIAFTKQYLVGTLPKFFNFAREASENGTGVALDELIRGDDPTPMYFDIEVKKKSEVGPVYLKRLLEQHCQARGIEADEGERNLLVDEFCAVMVKPFTEAQCRAGLDVMKTYLSEMLPRLVGDHPAEFFVLSGCRESKFSLHMICKHLYCDGAFLSAPLVAFELARRFVDWNLHWLLKIENDLSADNVNPHERMFRVKALMLDEWSGGGMVNERFLFSGYNDTPIDEAVYSKNHLLRAAGATKGDREAPVLAPVRADAPMMGTTKRFGSLFTMDDAGYKDWVQHLVSKPMISDTGLSQKYVVSGWKPSNAFPSPRTWLSHSQSQPRSVNDLAADFIPIGGDGCLDGCYVEGRLTVHEQRVLDYEARRRAAGGSLSNVGYPKEPIHADDLFTAEDGTVKAFKFFKPNDFIRHDHGGGVEKRASAKVFAGGFHCFACALSFGVVQEDTEEALFRCADMKVVSSDDPLAQIPIKGRDSNWGADGIDWEEAIKKKWFVVMAPMGAGKTEQLGQFMLGPAEVLGWRVLVVSFRQFLAAQQAIRLGTLCYLDLDQRMLEESPHLLTICLNSLWKLGEKEYDAIILDEAGLIRRHFLSSTVTSKLTSIYDKFCRLVRAAKHVILLQDGLSQDDVQFFTEIDGVQAEDCDQVTAYKLEKPKKIHPIQWTTDCFQAYTNMVDCYKRSFVTEDGVTTCKQPFMVFCSQCNFAEFIVESLREIAATIPGADPERVRGVWAALKNLRDPFCMQFVDDADEAASLCDVLVCTSVIGAGFSVSSHFPSFHAFLFNNILDFREEQQLIQRLRLKLIDQLREGTSRDSFMFVEKGHSGETLHVNVAREDLNKVRVMMMDGDESILAGLKTMENTHARIVAEKALSRAKHHTLWIEWGLTVESPFLEFPEGTEEEKKTWKSMKVEFMRRNSKKMTHIADMIRADFAEMGLSDFFATIEIENGMRLFREAYKDEQQKTLEDTFRYPEVAVRLAETMKDNKEGRDKIIGSKSSVNMICRDAARMCLWLMWVYKDIHSEQTGSFFGHMKRRPYASRFLKNFSEYQLLTWVVQPMLSHADPASRPEYLISPGATPFFNGLVFVPNKLLCEDLRRRLEPAPTDDVFQKTHKENLRSMARTMMTKHNARDSYLTSLYEDPKKAATFIKKTLSQIGVELSSVDYKRGAGAERRRRVVVTRPVKFAFALAHKRADEHLKPLLTSLLYSGNLSDPDKEWVREGIELYNIAAAGSQVPGVDVEAPRGVNDYCVIPRRLGELEVERAVGGLDALPTENEVHRTNLARERLGQAIDTIIRQEESFDRRRRLVEFEVTDRVIVDEDEDLTMDFGSQSQNNDDAASVQNPFVSDEAAED